MEWCASGCPEVVQGEILVVHRDETGGGKVVPFPFRLCYADSINHFGGISMKQAIIYVRGMERGALTEQLAVCRLYAARGGYHVVRIIFQQSNEPSVRRLSRCPAENIIIAKPAVLGSPYHFLWRRQQLNLAGKRVLCTMQISLQEENA